MAAKGGESEHVERPRLARSEIKTILVLVALLPVLALSGVGNQEIFNAYLVWAERSADLQVFGHKILTELLISVDAIVSVATIALMVVFWRWWATRWTEPDELGKLIIGCLIGAMGPLCLALGSSLTPVGGKTAFGWLLAFHLFNDIGFANVLPVGLAFYARSAPRAIAGSIVGLYYLHLFAGNLFVGWLGGQLEKMPAVQFWLIHAALVGGAAVVFLIVRFLFGHLLRPSASFEDDLATDLAQPSAR